MIPSRSAHRATRFRTRATRNFGAGGFVDGSTITTPDPLITTGGDSCIFPCARGDFSRSPNGECERCENRIGVRRKIRRRAVSVRRCWQSRSSARDWPEIGPSKWPRKGSRIRPRPGRAPAGTLHGSRRKRARRSRRGLCPHDTRSNALGHDVRPVFHDHYWSPAESISVASIRFLKIPS